MQAVILAGGLGTRLGELTRAIPKPMMPIAGRPYLEYQLRELARQEFEDIVLLTGYLGELIESHFGDGESLGLRIRYSQETTPLGTGGALRNAAHLLGESFLLIYGDSYLPIDYCDVLHQLARFGVLGIAVVYDNQEDTTVRNNIAVAPDGIIRKYAKGASESDLTHVEAGVLAFRRDVIDRLPEKTPASLEADLYPKLVAERQFAAYVTRQRFYDIGTPERLARIEQVFRP